MLFLLIYMGLIEIVTMSAKALAPQLVSQNLYGETNLFIAHDRRHQNRDSRSVMPRARLRQRVRVREALALAKAAAVPTAC
jgi:hypothetical protein